MLEIKYKEQVRSNIKDVLTALEKLRDIVSLATDFDDFITLSLLISSETLKDIQDKAANALDCKISDCKSTAEALMWWNWAQVEFPSVTMFHAMADNTSSEIRETAKED